MPQENIDLARRANEAWNRRDLEAMLTLSDPEIEYVNSPTALEPGTRHGHDGLKAVVRTQWAALTDARLEIDRIFDRGEDILTLGRLSRQLPGSEARLEDQSLILWRIRDRKLVRIEVLGFGSAEVQAALRANDLTE